MGVFTTSCVENKEYAADRAQHGGVLDGSFAHGTLRCRQFSSRRSYAHWNIVSFSFACLCESVSFVCLAADDFHTCIYYLIILHSIVTIIQGRSMKYDHEAHLFPRH